MHDYLAVLKREFEADDGSFLLHLRCDLVWHRDKFAALTTAMQRFIEADPTRTSIDRWIAEGFWFMDSFVKDHSSHPNFPRAYDGAYYSKAYERLRDLAYWLFTGESPYASGTLEPFHP